MTYYFRLHGIYDDRPARIHLEQVDSVEQGARDCGNGIHDLPGGNCIWHGYVEAASLLQAETKVIRAYRNE